MQLVSGRTLDEAIASCSSMQDRLALVPAIISVAQTLAFAHERGVVHRDIKPQNVIVGRHGQTIVIDWGIAKVRDVPETTRIGPRAFTPLTESGHVATQAGEVFGTIGYMAPEQALGRVDEIDERTDVFALGAMLYHVLAGHAPYQADSAARALDLARQASPPPLSNEARGAPRRLCEIVERAMARERAARYPTASHLARELESYTTDAIGAVGARGIEHVATAVSVLAVVVTTVGTTLVLRAVSFVEMGVVSILYSALAALGCVLSLLELGTGGRHHLTPLAAGLALTSLLAAFAYAAGGAMVVLGALQAPEIASDPVRWRLFLTGGMREAIGNVAWGCTLAALQAALLAIARRRVASWRAQGSTATP